MTSLRIRTLSIPVGLLCLVLAQLAPSLPGSVEFVDVTASTGIAFVHFSQPEKQYIMETVSGGVVLFDYDGDGLLDVYFVNSLTVETASDTSKAESQLYRNNGDGTFANVTSRAGVGFPGWGVGAVAADFDQDGRPDLYVTCLGPNRLYRNNGDGTFSERGAPAGVADPRWSAGAAVADYDNDGDLDLFVANYVDARLDNLASFEPCLYRGVKIMCDPRTYRGAGDSLYRNNGDGTFTEVSREAGVEDSEGYYGLGAVWADLDEDGFQDLYVANDSRPNFVYRNKGDGTFEEVGFLSGAALGEDGIEQGSMGVAVGDSDGDGRLDIFVTNYAYEYNSLFRQEDNFSFSDAGISSRAADSSLPLVGWGVEFFDYDNDGRLDLLVANGHLYPQVESLPGVGQRMAAYSLAVQTTYAQPKLLYHNEGGSFSQVTSMPAINEKRPSRGLAVGDLDNDGDVDVVVNDLDGAPMVLRNEGGNRAGKWIRIRLQGPKGNSLGIGARVVLRAGGAAQEKTVTAGSSYVSQSDTRLHFGIGKAETVENIEVHWPGGRVSRIDGARPNQELVIKY